jgi:predicted permease
MSDRLIQDLRFALRQLIRHPGFSVLLILTIAVAIGANVAIFSVLEGIVLRPLPYAEPDRLVAVWETPPDGRWYQPFTSPDYFDVREQSESLAEFGVLTHRWFNLAGGGEPVRVRGAYCTASLLELLGVPPARGRLFTEDEEAEGDHRVLVLSHGLWQSQFGADPDVVGQQVNVNGEPWEIVGVMPESFRFPTPWGGRDDSRAWAPLVLSRDDALRSRHWLGAIGRLAEGITPDDGEAELAVIAAQLAEAYPDTNSRTRMWIEPMMQRTLARVRSALFFLLAIVGLVLLVACANVASMLLARGMNRAPEFAIRASMGAGGRGLVRQLLTESFLLSGIGGIGGVLLAYWGVGTLRTLIPESVPRAVGIGVNPQVLAFAVVVTVVTGLLVGLAPSLLASRTDLAEVIKHGRLARGGGASRNRFLSGLVALQLALGFVLVNAAVILVVSYGNVMEQPTNFGTDEVLVTSISLVGPAYETPEQRRAFWEELLVRARGLPGVVHAGLTSKLPFMGGTNGGVLVRDEVFDPQVQIRLVEQSFVDDGYHAAMGIGLLAGRTFDQRDMDAAAVMAGADSAVVELPLIVNRTMAEQAWPESDALGELVRPESAIEYYRARVVGIVEDVRQWGPEQGPLPEIYFPHTAEVWGPVDGRLVIRAAGDPSALAPVIRQAVREIDHGIPVTAPFTMASLVHDSTAGRRFSMLLVGLFTATALLLIVAGTYGVVSYAVSQRTHEIGVRMTLGADKARVVRLFLRRAAVLLATGLVVGILGALAASTLTRSMVYGISALSPMHLAIAAAVMILIVLAAILVPVLRATGVDPLTALRVE